MRSLLRGLLAGMAWLAPLSAVAALPYVVLILLDNEGQEWFSRCGSEEGCTPHIDELATGSAGQAAMHRAIDPSTTAGTPAGRRLLGR